MHRSLRNISLVLALSGLLVSAASANGMVKAPAGMSGIRSTEYVTIHSLAPGDVGKAIGRLRKKYPKETILKRTVVLDESTVRSEQCNRLLLTESFRTARMEKGLFFPAIGKGGKSVPILLLEYYLGDNSGSQISISELAGLVKEKDYYGRLNDSWKFRFASNSLKTKSVNLQDGTEVPYATYKIKGGGFTANTSIWYKDILVSISAQGLGADKSRATAEHLIIKAIRGLVWLQPSAGKQSK